MTVLEERGTHRGDTAATATAAAAAGTRGVAVAGAAVFWRCCCCEAGDSPSTLLLERGDVFVVRKLAVVSSPVRAVVVVVLGTRRMARSAEDGDVPFAISLAQEVT